MILARGILPNYLRWHHIRTLSHGAPASVMDALSEDPKSHTLKVLSHNQYHTPTGLSPKDCPTSPIPLFEDWFKDAVARNVSEPEAITLATATSSGVPSARMVLFKAVDSTGFTFYTNYESRKSQEMEATGHAALVFYWREIHRSVRVVGSVEKVSKEESQKYFDSRPLGSKIGAWASPQSRVIGEGEIQNRVKEIEKQFGVNDAGERSGIPVPPYWGGWKVTPLEVEFWCGKPSRLHDRVRYLRKSITGEWTTERLSP